MSEPTLQSLHEIHLTNLESSPFKDGKQRKIPRINRIGKELTTASCLLASTSALLVCTDLEQNHGHGVTAGRMSQEKLKDPGSPKKTLKILSCI